MSKNLLVLSVVIFSVISLMFMPFIIEGIDEVSDDAEDEHGENDLIFTALKILIPGWIFLTIIVFLIEVVKF